MSTQPLLLYEYADKYCIQCNRLKSKFWIFKGKGCIEKSSSIEVNGLKLDNVDSTVHLDQTISTNDKDSMTSDGICKIWKSVDLL